MSWRYFDEGEFLCRCGECSMRPMAPLIDMLDEARHLAQVPFRVTSGVRCVEHNRRVGGAENSAHLGGFAADLECRSSFQRMRIVRSLLRAGFDRIGIAERFVHADCDPSLPEGVIWTYPPR